MQIAQKSVVLIGPLLPYNDDIVIIINTCEFSQLYTWIDTPTMCEDNETAFFPLSVHSSAVTR